MNVDAAEFPPSGRSELGTPGRGWTGVTAAMAPAALTLDHHTGAEPHVCPNYSLGTRFSLPA